MTGKFAMTTLVMALALASSGALAQAAGSGPTHKTSAKAAPPQFIKEAIQGNLAEIHLGQLGKEKGASQVVRDFGQRLVADHTAANEKAMSAAQAANVTPPTEVSSKQTKTYQAMSKLSGAAFDSHYIAHMVSDHKHDISEYTRAAAAGGPIGNYAKASLPTLREHLRLAEQIEHGQVSNNKSKTKEKP